LIGKRATLLFILSTVFCSWMARGAMAAQSHGPTTVDGVLRQLDRSSKDFHSLSADVERTKVTVVVNDKSTENGSLLVRGDKMLLEMKAPNARTILRTGDNLFVYTPGLNRVEEYNLAQHRGLVDQRTLEYSRLETVAHLKFFHRGDQFFGKSIINASLDVKPIRADAGLAGIAVFGNNRPFDCSIQISVVENDKRRIASKFQ